MLHNSAAITQLSHGDACSACRGKKLKCDGAKPSCRRCVRTKAVCRYLGPATRPRLSHQLETRVLELELQIKTLEQAHNKALLSDRIFQRIRSFVFDTPKPASLNARFPFFPLSNGPLSPDKSRGRIVQRSLEEGYGSTIARLDLDQLFQGWNPEDGISEAQSLCLIRLFIPVRIHFCWYGSINDLLSYHSLDASHPQAIHPALLSIIYLCSCSIVKGILEPHCDYFLRRTRQSLRDSLAYADRLPHFLWASLIFSIWLGTYGKFTEAYVVMVGTIRFGLGCGLVGDRIQEGLLAPPSTAEEAIDRLSLAHAIYQMDRVLTIYSPFGSCLSSDDRWNPAADSGMADLQRALSNPKHAWSHVSALDEVVSLLDQTHLECTAVCMLQERVEILVTSIFDPPEKRILFGSLDTQNSAEFNILRAELALWATRRFSIDDPIGLQVNEDTAYANPPLVMNQMFYHGAVMLLYNIPVVLHEKSIEIPDVDVEEARAKMLESANFLMDIIKLIKGKNQISRLHVDATLFVYVLNIVRIYIRELGRPEITNSSRIGAYCDSLVILVDFLQDLLALFPSWGQLNPTFVLEFALWTHHGGSHLFSASGGVVRPLRGILPSSASVLASPPTSDSDPSSTDDNEEKLSPVVRAWA